MMFRTIAVALRGGVLTEPYPQRPAPPGPLFRGKVEVDFARCRLTGACAEACPTPALTFTDDRAAARAELRIDLGHCVFCGLCEEACPEGAVRLLDVFELAVRKKEDLVTTGGWSAERGPAPGPP